MFYFRIISFIMTAIRAYEWVLIIYALMSWFPRARESVFGNFIRRLAEPYIAIFDRLIPSIGGISFNVIIAVFVLQLLERLALYLLL